MRASLKTGCGDKKVRAAQAVGALALVVVNTVDGEVRERASVTIA